MEVADAEFLRSMQYLAAAARCEGWCGDDLTEGRLQRLADDYRARANALMLPVGGHAASGKFRLA